MGNVSFRESVIWGKYHIVNVSYAKSVIWRKCDMGKCIIW